MSDRTFERAVRDWLDDGSDRTPRHAIDGVLLAVKTTPQERGLRIPWRFSTMPTYMRLAAAVAIISGVGIGASTLLGRGPGIGGPGQMPSPTPSQVAPGITGWTSYTSAVYPRLSFAYPANWSVRAPATRTWQVGDAFPADELPYADTFVSPGEGDSQIGFVVWEMPHEGDGGPDTFDRLKVWAQTFCNDVLATSCEGFTRQAVPMCHLLDDGCDGGDGAILVPTPEAQYALFRTWQSEMFDSTTVRIVVVPRQDSFAPAGRYGGSVELLKSVLTTMNVWTPGRQPGS